MLNEVKPNPWLRIATRFTRYRMILAFGKSESQNFHIKANIFLPRGMLNEVKPEEWDTKANRATGRSNANKQVNSLLEELKASLHTFSMKCKDRIII